ncbi:hypothetical protein FOL47_010894 [Perkinsus chesapeaki]|uniref:Uncharacterized protein n=1 Tax=Perkinsus chesapeaki TaxID=330153 RepID=A0A7J6KZT3_PERCH|nr:hypothetical protein FOL47_010894 [Perkinsus chesapeaki]
MRVGLMNSDIQGGIPIKEADLHAARAVDETDMDCMMPIEIIKNELAPVRRIETIRRRSSKEKVAIYRLLEPMEKENEVERIPIQDAWTINEIALVAKKGDAFWKKLPVILNENDNEALNANFRVTLDLRYVNANVGVLHSGDEKNTTPFQHLISKSQDQIG